MAELADHCDLCMRTVETLVVDEVDQFLAGEFGEQVHRLLRTVPRDAQKVLVHATGDVDIVRKCAATGNLLKVPVLLRVGGELRVPKNIEHDMCVAPGRLKLETVWKIINTERDPKVDRAIVFVDEPRKVDLVGERLWQMGVAVGTLRGNAHKSERKEVVDAFGKGKVKVMISTEIAARCF